MVATRGAVTTNGEGRAALEAASTPEAPSTVASRSGPLVATTTDVTIAVAAAVGSASVSVNASVNESESGSVSVSVTGSAITVIGIAIGTGIGIVAGRRLQQHGVTPRRLLLLRQCRLR